jgi:hypothetical protein
MVNIVFDSKSDFVNQELFGTISYSSRNINSTTVIFGIGGGSVNLVFGFCIDISGNIYSNLFPSTIKTTTYANINSVYYTNTKL